MVGKLRGTSAAGIRLGLAGTASLALATALAGPAWQVVPGPSGPGDRLTGVSCVSSSNCVAVGQAGSGATLAERWNGRSWSITPGATLQAPTSSLSSVDCVSARSCWAIGVGRGNLFEHWNGSQWRVTSSPHGSWSPIGLSCSGSKLCAAVGYTSVVADLATWNGEHWVVTHGAKSETRAHLTAVSCPSRTFCEAVGVLLVGSTSQIPAAEMWNGLGWTNSDPIAPRFASLDGVSCWSSSGCLTPMTPQYRSSMGCPDCWSSRERSRRLVIDGPRGMAMSRMPSPIPMCSTFSHRVR